MPTSLFEGDDLPVIAPTDRDVLLGRGRPFQYHPGTVRLREMIDPYRSEYQSAPRQLKMPIAHHVFRMILQDDHPDTGGRSTHLWTPRRFLKQNTKRGLGKGSHKEPEWIPATTEEIINKISHCLRSKKKGTGVAKSCTAIGHRRLSEDESANCRGAMVWKSPAGRDTHSTTGMKTPGAGTTSEQGASTAIILASGSSLSRNDQGQSSTKNTSSLDTTRVGQIEMEREKSDSVCLNIIDCRVVPTAFSSSEARRAARSTITREIRHLTSQRTVECCKPRYIQLLSTDPPTKNLLQPANASVFLNDFTCTFVFDQIPNLDRVAWIHGPGSEPPSPSLFD